MSAKWRALQHRHRYTYSTVIFPSSYIDSLSQSLLSSNPKFLPFFNELNRLISLTSVYAQVAHVKNLASSFTNLLSSLKDEDPSILEAASRFYIWIMFLDNSTPLHRTLVSALSKVSDGELQGLIFKCFRQLCEECDDGDGGKNVGRRRFCLSRVALSIMGMPKLGYLVKVIEDCAVLVAWDAVLGLESVVCETTEWASPSPIVMEQCQEALSCLYYLLQRFPVKFSGFIGSGGGELNVMERILGVLVNVLKSMVFSRDCFVAAGVSFCSALQACLSAQELGLVIIGGIFGQTTSNFHGIDNGGQSSIVISKVPFNGDLSSEIHSFSVLSRLCLIRGILTAVSRDILNSHFVVSSVNMNVHAGNSCHGSSVKTILYDEILPELCDYCENPIDGHFNFHALTVLQICLQQMKTSMLSKVTVLSDNYVPVPEELGTRILRIIWNNMEDPLSQTVKQVHLIFDLYLDIQSTLCWGLGSEKIRSFLQKIASDLLHLGPRCKGRYVPLASLTKRLGARTMLDMSPDLLHQTADAYAEDDVCCAATTFLTCFLEHLRDECWNSYGVEQGYTFYRGQCLPPFLCGLAYGVSKLRTNLNTYALPVLLELDMDGVFPMLAFISVGSTENENGFSYHELGCTNMELLVEQKVAVLVSLIKVCRSLALIEGDVDLGDTTETLERHSGMGTEVVKLYAYVSIKGVRIKILVEWLLLALTHVDESLRVDAAESLFLNPKTSSLPSHLELTLLKEAIPLNMRSSSTGFQMKWTSLFRKFFSRVRTALERQFKQGSWQPIANCSNSKACSKTETDTAVIQRAEDLFSFMRWLSCFLFFSCYPSAPYKRKIMAMELILTMLNVWPIVVSSQDVCASVSPDSCLYPYSRGITSHDSTLLLVGSIIDSWDRLRESSFRILLHFPTPLPGISNKEMIHRMITWAKKLVCSPRVRESDAGALTLRLVFRKYVLELGWVVRASVDVVCIPSPSELVTGGSQIDKQCPPVVEYIKSLIDWLNVAVEDGENDLSEACKNSFVHGVLLTLRYTFEELDWDSREVASSISEMRHILERLLELVMRITALALWVVSADAWYLTDMDEMVDVDAYTMDEVGVAQPGSENEGLNFKHPQHDRPEQIVMVGCWLAMKEVSLLLGTIIRKIPLPIDSCSGSLKPSIPVSNAANTLMPRLSNVVLDLRQLGQVGNHFLEVLLKMKHNGAIDKTRAGFTALCNRLLCSNDPRLCKLTESWMEQLMERTVAKGQTVDNLLRRSAGIPAAFIALFLSEPEGAPKKLLPRALRWLINVANSSLLGSSDVKSTSVDSCKFSLMNSEHEHDCINHFELKVQEKNSKNRDEGVVPTVHAFNVLRTAFDDTNLATDTSGFAADALIVSIRSFSSPYWEIRNSACLAYSALVRRMMGFLNVQKRESARHVLTGLEFFHRYPSLHPFIYNELKIATELLRGATSGHSESNLAKVVHPSLCPMLILLSRLKPSTVAIKGGDDLDPFLFMPFIRSCSTQSNLRVRVLACRALTGLVSNEKLPTVLLNIASELPCLEDYRRAAPMSSIRLDLIDGAHQASYNSIHGMLLQLSSLIDTNCRNLANSAKKGKIISDLIQVLRKRYWIGSPRQCPCPMLNASFLSMLDHMLSIARKGHLRENFYVICDLLLKLSKECLDMKDSYGLSYFDPTIAELRKQAVISYFSCVLQASEEETEEAIQMPQTFLSPGLDMLKEAERKNVCAGLQERLLHSLSDSSYEVRLATLKWLLKFIKSRNFSDEVNHQSSSEIRIVQQWTKSNLQPTMMKLLDSEKYHRCTCYILRIIFGWNLLQFQVLSNKVSVDASFVGNLDHVSVTWFWDKLMSLYESTRHVKTQEALICCMAICVKQYGILLTSHILAYTEKETASSSESHELDRFSDFYGHITFFVNLIKEHSSPSEPVNIRKAAAESIVASGLLEQAEFAGNSVSTHDIPSEIASAYSGSKDPLSIYAHQVLEVWFVCIKLLEDEDDEIRQRLAVDVQKCFLSGRSKSDCDAAGVPTQVEKVMELSFAHLSSTFGHWIYYFEYLSQWVQNAANYVVSKGDLVRRVFDKEIDNHHEEKLFLSQLCCYHLEKLTFSRSCFGDKPSREEFRNYLYRWRKKFCNQLMSFAKDHMDTLGEANWIGGVGNHKDAFLPLYANLLGFYALTNCIFNAEIDEGTRLLFDVVELGRTINPFLRNPLICNLYFSLVKSHEKMVGAASDQLICPPMDDSLWDGFDPYFLLRQDRNCKIVA